MLRIAALLVVLPLAAAADEVADLYQALGLPRIVAVMQAEGIAYGDAMAGDLFAGRAPQEWEATVRAIYDLGWMEAQVLANLRAELDGADVGTMLEFFATEPGLTIASLEVAGREALLDETVESAAGEAAEAAAQTPRMDLIRTYITANDLIEANVAGALNANYAFYVGMVQGGAFEAGLTEEEILAQVWAQEAAIRASTTDWLETFLYLAYGPLSDADLEAYIDFSRSPAGQQMTAGLFAAFDPMFDDVSRALGLGAARYLAGDEL